MNKTNDSEKQLQVKKIKQGMTYSCKEKMIIMNVFKYFRAQFPHECVTEIVRRTSKASGCSEKSIFQFRKEDSSAEGFKAPSKTKIRKNININSRFIKYDNTVRQSIRSIIADLKNMNITPSLNTILKKVKADSTLPTFSLMTLRRLLFDMGFCYEKNGSKQILVDKQQCCDINNQNEIGNGENLTVVKPQQKIQETPKLSNLKNENSEPSVFIQNDTNYVQSFTLSEPAMSEPKLIYVLPLPESNCNTHNTSVVLNVKNDFISTIQTNINHEATPWINPQNGTYLVKQQ